MRTILATLLGAALMLSAGSASATARAELDRKATETPLGITAQTAPRYMWLQLPAVLLIVPTYETCQEYLEKVAALAVNALEVQGFSLGTTPTALPSYTCNLENRSRQGDSQ